MLTSSDKEIQQTVGLIPPDRLRALKHALIERSKDARAAAEAAPDQDSQHAAALRGRKLAYVEAAIMVQHIMDGQALRPRANSAAKARARKWHERQAVRRAERKAKING